MALACVVSPSAASPREPMPGPSVQRPRGTPVEAIERACERCHADIAAEWRGSLHASSSFDPLYLDAFSREPLPFCEGCHAPEGRPLAHLGVGCVTCHLLTGEVLAAPGKRAAPHPVRRVEAFAGVSACASCHEFEFPGRVVGPSLMQSTVSEHRRSAYADRSCADCHMPLVGEGRRAHRSHAFAAREGLADAVKVDARWEGQALVVTVEPSGVGHALPTGDLFRRLSVSVSAEGEGESRSEVRYLARHAATARREVMGPFDDRPGVDPSRPASELWFLFEWASEGATATWRVSYERVMHPTSGVEREAVVADAVPLSSGVAVLRGPP